MHWTLNLLLVTCTIFVSPPCEVFPKKEQISLPDRHVPCAPVHRDRLCVLRGLRPHRRRPRHQVRQPAWGARILLLLGHPSLRSDVSGTSSGWSLVPAARLRHALLPVQGLHFPYKYFFPRKFIKTFEFFRLCTASSSCPSSLASSQSLEWA